jgi:hypothetical protein
LGIQFDAMGLNLIDEKADAIFSYTVYSGEEARHSINPIGHPTNQELLGYWRRQQVWERVPNKEFLDGMEKHRQQGYRPGVVIDAPFDQGTVVMGIQAVVGENGELIELLQASCPSLSLGSSRSRDI